MDDNQSDMVDQLVRLKSLRDSGALSDPEFQAAKTRLLGVLPASSPPPRPGTERDIAPAPLSPKADAPANDGFKWKCTSCGKANHPTRKTCWECGKERGSAESLPVAASPSGSEVVFGALYDLKRQSQHSRPLPPASPERWNGLAITSFVLGLVPVLPLAGSILAIVFGVIGKRQADDKKERGRALASWGIALGVLDLLGWIILIGVLVAASNNYNTISGSIALTDSSSNYASMSNGQSCSGDDGYNDIAQGTVVQVSNQAGAVLAISALGSGTIQSATCVFPFSVPHVPSASFYQIELSNRGNVSFAKAELQADNWTADMTLGS